MNPSLLKLKEFTQGYMISLKGIQKAFENEFNAFTLQVLNIIDSMVRLGFYENEKELKSMANPLITLLDGSLDFFSKEEENLFLLKQNQEH